MAGLHERPGSHDEPGEAMRAGWAWTACLAAACTRPNPAYQPSRALDAAPADGMVDLEGPGPSDAVVADVRDVAPDAFSPPAGCGTGVANLAGINDADGVVVDGDGTVYFLTDDSTH